MGRKGRLITVSLEPPRVHTIWSSFHIILQQLKERLILHHNLFCTILIQTHPQSNANLGSVIIGSFILHRTNAEEGCIPASERGWRFEAADQIKQSNDENFNANTGSYTSFE